MFESNDHKFSKDEIEDCLIELLDIGYEVEIAYKYVDKRGNVSDIVSENTYAMYRIDVTKDYEGSFDNYLELKKHTIEYTNTLNLVTSAFKKLERLGTVSIRCDIHDFRFRLVEKNPLKVVSDEVGFEQCKSSIGTTIKSYVSDFDVYSDRKEKTIRYVLSDDVTRSTFSTISSKLRRMSNGAGWGIEGNWKVKRASQTLKEYKFTTKSSFQSKEIIIKYEGIKEK